MEDTTAQIIAIITSDVEHGRAHVEFAEKERQLRVLIQQLTAADALALKRRLKAARADDPLTAAFLRLTRDRRDRLMAFLEDPARAVRPID